MGFFEDANRRFQQGMRDAQERAKFRAAAIASLKRQLAEEKKVEEARKRPLSQADRSNLAQVANEIDRNEREMKRIERVMHTNLNQYYEEKLDRRYQELMAE